MQYKITVGKVSIETDDLKSAASSLFALARSEKEIGRIQIHKADTAPVKRKQSKHKFKKQCHLCGLSFRGLRIHLSKRHNIFRDPNKTQAQLPL